jgi:hypothetical protein
MWQRLDVFPFEGVHCWKWISASAIRNTAPENLLACHLQFANASWNIIDGHEQLISQQTVSYDTIFLALPFVEAGTLQITVMNKQHK